MESVFARAGRDQIRIRIHLADVDGLEKFLSLLFRRVLSRVSAVCLAVVTTFAYFRVNIFFLLLLVLTISFWLVALVFLLPNPQRYPFRVRRARKAGRIL